MAVQMSASLTQRTYFWTNFKTISMAKNLSIQYDTDTFTYTVWGYESPEVYICTIWRGTVPQPMLDATGYTQVQNDADLADFEANYIATANGVIFGNIQYQNQYRNITGNGTTVIKSSNGILHSISVNNNATGGTVIVYDNTAASGTKIMTLRMGTPSGGVLSTTGYPGPAQIGPLGAVFTTGLTIVTSGSASNDITVYYQ